MRFSFHNFSVQFTSYASRAEMEVELKRSGNFFEIIEVEQEYARVFCSLEFHPDLRNQESTPQSIGLCSSRTGIQPELLVNPTDALLYVGMGESILIINRSLVLLKRLDLPSPFYWMSLFSELDRILVVHETGLLWLEPEGSIVWRHDTDIISFIYVRAPNIIEVKLLEGGAVSLDLKTGRALSNEAGAKTSANP